MDAFLFLKKKRRAAENFELLNLMRASRMHDQKKARAHMEALAREADIQVLWED
jgi:hypothetical protein